MWENVHYFSLRVKRFVNMYMACNKRKRHRLNVFRDIEHVLGREQFTLNKSHQKVDSKD